MQPQRRERAKMKIMSENVPGAQQQRQAFGFLQDRRSGWRCSQQGEGPRRLCVWTACLSPGASLCTIGEWPNAAAVVRGASSRKRRPHDARNRQRHAPLPPRTEEIQQAMRKKPKPNWNETVPPIINKHHKKIEALGVSLLEFVVYTGRLNRRFGGIVKVYIAGPMSGHLILTVPLLTMHFHLWSKGHCSESRLSTRWIVPGRVHGHRLSMLRQVDAIYMLEGWEHPLAPERRMPWPRSWKWKLSSRKRIAPHEQSLTS
jgi:hypothetical protein